MVKMTAIQKNIHNVRLGFNEFLSRFKKILCGEENLKDPRFPNES